MLDFDLSDSKVLTSCVKYVCSERFVHDYERMKKYKTEIDSEMPSDIPVFDKGWKYQIDYIQTKGFFLHFLFQDQGEDWIMFFESGTQSNSYLSGIKKYPGGATFYDIPTPDEDGMYKVPETSEVRWGYRFF